jgi:hypothetical protein
MALSALEQAWDLVQVSPRPLLSMEFDGDAARWYHDEVQKEILPRDAYPEPMEEIIASAEREQQWAVSGEFVDRVARDGALPALDPAQAIWRQFPIGCNLSALVLRGYTHKVTLARASVAITGGNHEVRENPRSFRWSGVIAAVHTSSGTIPSSRGRQQRLESYRRRGVSYWAETQRFLEYLGPRARLDLEPLETLDYDGCTPTEAWAFVRRLREGNPFWNERHGCAPVS